MSATSPQITDLSWGEVTTTEGAFRDAKLWPGGGRGWDWNETGTHHRPGVQPADVEELLDHDPDTVLLSRGQQGRLQVTTEAVDLIEEHDAEVEILETGAAVDRYNELAAEGRAVAALIHSTC